MNPKRMQKEWPVILSLLLGMALLAGACKDVDPKDCAMAECSEQFNMVYVSVVDTLAQPVSLDTFKLVNMLDKTPVELTFSATDFAEMKTRGSYLISDDSMVPAFRNSQIVVEFTGILANKEVAKGAITIDVDCCHVSYYYGSSTIVTGLVK